MLKGGQKKLDKNKDGKISGEDFKMMKKAALGVAVLATKKGQKAAKKMLKGKTQMSPALNYLDRNMGGSAESTKGYGAARTSGMGLQDESLPAGKTLDYYKDIM